MKHDSQGAAGVLGHFGLERATVTPLETGLINRTWVVDEQGKKYILQRVNPMFGLEIHEDIAAVTTHLHRKGQITPRLIPTLEDHLYLQQAGRVWRLLSHVPGTTYHTVKNPRQAAEAGKVLGRFHKALLDLDYSFRNRRANVHETETHLQVLRSALDTHRDHPEYRNVRPLAEEILGLAGRLPVLPGTRPRKVHGDPKITNCLFGETSGNGLCLIDFDTLGEMPLPLELGDAMRSWCNPAGENSDETRFSIENFHAGLQGYAREAGDFILIEEWQNIVPATRIICLELAARFCADALNECFFHWNRQLFSSRSLHNQVRAAGQLNTCKSLIRQQDAALQAVRDVFS